MLDLSQSNQLIPFPYSHIPLPILPKASCCFLFLYFYPVQPVDLGIQKKKEPPFGLPYNPLDLSPFSRIGLALFVLCVFTPRLFGLSSHRQITGSPLDFSFCVPVFLHFHFLCVSRISTNYLGKPTYGRPVLYRITGLAGFLICFHCRAGHLPRHWMTVTWIMMTLETIFVPAPAVRLDTLSVV